MILLSRYLIRQFLSTLFSSLTTFVIIFVVVDLVQNLDRLIDSGLPASAIAAYYGFFLPYILVLTLPVGMLLATLFTMGQLTKYGELTAIKASGISLYRILAVLLKLALLISLVDLGFGELVVPATNENKARIKRLQIEGWSEEGLAIQRNAYFKGKGGRQYYFRSYDSRHAEARGVLIIRRDGSRIEETIQAQSMRWNGAGWTLQEGFVRRFPKNEQNSWYHKFALWESTELFERPANFARKPKETDAMGFFELWDYIQVMKQTGRLTNKPLVDLHLKVAFPLANVIIVLFGATLASYVRRSGAALGFAVSIGICFLYWGILKISQALGYNDLLSPAVAAWLPNLVFGLLGTGLLIRVPK